MPCRPQINNRSHFLYGETIFIGACFAIFRLIVQYYIVQHYPQIICCINLIHWLARFFCKNKTANICSSLTKERSWKWIFEIDREMGSILHPRWDDPSASSSLQSLVRWPLEGAHFHASLLHSEISGRGAVRICRIFIFGLWIRAASDGGETPLSPTPTQEYNRESTQASVTADKRGNKSLSPRPKGDFEGEGSDLLQTSHCLRGHHYQWRIEWRSDKLDKHANSALHNF